MYCNYSKDKFGNEVSFIIPSWLLGKVNECSYNTMAEDISFLDQLNYDKILRAKASWYTSAFLDAERCYLEALSTGSTPQEARDVLPLSTKTELCMTGFQSDWERLLDIRYNESTGRVHPDMKILMGKLVEVINNNNLQING